MPTAFVLIRCDEDARDILTKLASKKEIRDLQQTVGHYDFVARITSPSMDYLDEIIEDIRRHEQVRLTNVLRMSETVEVA